MSATIEITREDYHRNMILNVLNCTENQLAKVEDLITYCLRNKIDIFCKEAIMNRDINLFQDFLKKEIYKSILDKFDDHFYWLTTEEQIEKMSDLGMEITAEQADTLSEFIRRDKELIPLTLDKKFDVVFDYLGDNDTLKNNLLFEVAKILLN